MSTRAEAMEATRARIVEAAHAAFFSRWYEEVTVREVARDAGVALQTLRNHFPSKEELFLAAAERRSESIETTRFAVEPGDIDGAITVLVDDYERTGDTTMRMLAVEERIAVIAPLVQEGREGHERWVKRTFPAAFTGLDATTARRRLAQLVVALDVYTWKIFRQDKGLSRDETITAMRELVLALHGEPVS